MAWKNLSESVQYEFDGYSHCLTGEEVLSLGMVIRNYDPDHVVEYEQKSELEKSKDQRYLEKLKKDPVRYFLHLAGKRERRKTLTPEQREKKRAKDRKYGPHRKRRRMREAKRFANMENAAE